MCMRDFNSPMVMDSIRLRKSYKMVSSIKSDGMDYPIQQKFGPVNLTTDSSRVFCPDYYAIFQFFTTRQNFEILSIETTKNAKVNYFQVPFQPAKNLVNKNFLLIFQDRFHICETYLENFY